MQLYTCTSVDTISLQLDFLFGGKVQSIFINVLLNLSYCPFVYGWYGWVHLHSSEIRSLLKFQPWSEIILSGRPKLTINWSLLKFQPWSEIILSGRPKWTINWSLLKFQPWSEIILSGRPKWTINWSHRACTVHFAVCDDVTRAYAYLVKWSVIINTWTSFPPSVISMVR